MKVNSKIKTIILSLIVMALWGSLFPCIKIGYKAFSIDTESIPSILMFAGVRFTICGLIICVISYFKKDKIESPKVKTIGAFVIIGLFSIILHYSFSYIGLSITDSSKTAIIKQLGTLIYICFAFLFFKNEKFSIYKIVGAIVGFLGIITINIGSGGISFSLGDFLIILSSFCTVASGVISKKILQSNSPFWLTGISQLSGGIILVIVAFITGASMISFNVTSLLVFLYICFASITSYLLYNYVLKTSDLSNLYIIKFAEPLFACIFGALLLNENVLKWQYLLAFVLISTGIMLGNKNLEKKQK